MTTRKLIAIYATTGLLISLPFAFLHGIARPDDAPITLLQRATAVVANFFGPWGVAVVRLVDFPNAGMREFSWVLALGLTLLGGVLIVLARWIKRRPLQLLLVAVWALFVFIWFGIGFLQIASGLL